MHKMNDKDFEILDYIKKQRDKTGFPPSVREICAAVGLSSTSTVSNRLKKLQAYGYIEKSISKNRSLRVVNYPSRGTDTEYVDVPMYGNVAAGIPITAVQDWETKLAIPRDFVRNRELFVLKIKGESMINAGILDGDYVIVNHQENVENGDIAVALVSENEEATVKTFYKEKGYFRLQPENDSMEPIIVDEVSVIGKVIGVFREI